MRLALVLLIGVLVSIACMGVGSPHYSCWLDAEEQVVQRIELAVSFPATLELKDTALSLSRQSSEPLDESLDIFGVEFESSNQFGVPVRGRAIITYRKADCVVDDIWVHPTGGFFPRGDS